MKDEDSESYYSRHKCGQSPSDGDGERRLLPLLTKDRSRELLLARSRSASRSRLLAVSRMNGRPRSLSLWRSRLNDRCRPVSAARRSRDSERSRALLITRCWRVCEFSREPEDNRLLSLQTA